MALYLGNNKVSMSSFLTTSTGGGSSNIEFADSLEWLNENGDASKQYVLPDGYIYAKKKMSSPDFTNLFDKSSAVLNKVRSGNNGETLTDSIGVISTGLMPISCRTDISNPTKIRIKGAKMVSWTDTGDRVTYYDGNGTYKWYSQIKKVKYEETDGIITVYGGWSTNNPVANCDVNYKQFTISIHATGSASVSATSADLENVIITVDEPITYSEKYVWVNTGILYNSGGTSVSDDHIEEVARKISPLKDKKVLVLGDSISTDVYGNYTKWVSVLKNEGFLPSDTVNNSQHATGFVARYTAEDSNAQNSFVQRIQAVTDKSSYDYVIIFGGINDYIQNIEMGGETGKTDKATYFKPAVNWFFDYVVKNFIQARIVVLLPLRTYNVYKNTAGGSQATGYYQQAYSDYIKEIAKSYCLPILNLTEESGFCPFVTEFKNKWTLIPSGYTSADGVHPNKDYQAKYLAPMIRDFLSRYISY